MRIAYGRPQYSHTFEGGAENKEGTNLK